MFFGNDAKDKAFENWFKDLCCDLKYIKEYDCNGKSKAEIINDNILYIMRHANPWLIYTLVKKHTDKVDFSNPDIITSYMECFELKSSRYNTYKKYKPYKKDIMEELKEMREWNKPYVICGEKLIKLLHIIAEHSQKAGVDLNEVMHEVAGRYEGTFYTQLKFSVMEMLVTEFNVDVNSTDSEGKTVLEKVLFAVNSGDKDIGQKKLVELFLKHDADPTRVDLDSKQFDAIRPPSFFERWFLWKTERPVHKAFNKLKEAQEEWLTKQQDNTSGEQTGDELDLGHKKVESDDGATDDDQF